MIHNIAVENLLAYANRCQSLKGMEYPFTHLVFFEKNKTYHWHHSICYSSLD